MHEQRSHSVGITNPLWMEADTIEHYWETSGGRTSAERHWDGYCSKFSASIRTNEDVRDDIRRRQRMAEAMYDI